MAPRTLPFATALTPDPALQQSARYLFDSVDRQSIDNQIRALQTFASVDHLNAKGGTYVPFVGADGAVGDVVCSAGGLGGKPTVTLATADALVLSGVMFGILAEACVEGNKAHVVHSGILGPEVTGLAAGDEGWVRVTDNRCEKVALLADVDICVGWVDSGGYLRVGAQPTASVTTTFPPTAFYILNSASVPAALTNGVPGLNLTSTLTFASTSVAPLEMRRTNAATAADVDVGYAEALSTGTTAANFGPAWRFYAKKGSGGSETTGTLSMVWSNVGAGTEASKFVVKTRSAGGAAATALAVSETEITATALAGVGTRFVTVTAGGVLGASSSVGADASAKYLTDASATVNANDIPIRALSGTLGFARAAEKLASFTVTEAAGTNYEAIGIGHVVSASGAGTAGDGISLAARLVDATPSVRRVGRLRWEWTSPVALLPRADAVLSVLSTDGEHDWLRLTDAGALRLPAYSTAARRPIFAGTDGTITATAIQSSEVTTALGYTPVTNARTLTGTSPITVAGDNSAHDLSADRTIAFSVGADVPWAGHGITGIASLDNSGGAQTIGANTTALTIGKSTTAATFAGGVTINGAGAADILTVQKDALGTTKTVGEWLYNATNSSTQVSPMLAWSAYNGGTRVNAGWQWEPSSTSAGALVLYVGTGATAPATKHFALTSQNSTWGSGVEAYGFYVISGGLGGSGLRAFGNNTGGYTWDGSDDALLIKSYNTKSVKIQTGADSGGTGGVTRFILDGSGQGYVTFVPRSVTSSSNAVTFPLATCQNIRHTTTENTTVTFSGAAPGMRGTLDFIQGGTGRTVTMPTNGSGVEYDAAILALTVTGIVDATANTRTVLQYYVTDSPATRVYVYARSTSTIPA